MGVIHVTDRAGQRHTLEAIEGLCGGACECATCHVFVAENWLGKLYPPTGEEEDQLDTVVTKPNSRLSCQILWTPELDGLEVTLAPTGA
jgi:2Fe-2S ferredoxin